MKVRSGAAVVLAVLMLAFACWAVVPAPTFATLPLAVAVPELAPRVLAFALVLGVLVWLLARGRPRAVATALTALAAACAAWPALAAPFAWQAEQRALDDARIPPARSRAFAVDVVRDVPVRLRDGSSLALDLYRPRAAGAAPGGGYPRHAAAALPLIVGIYGGAWSFGSRAGFAPLARWYAERGYAVAVVDYRHAPRYRFPVQRDDVEDALRALAANARAWHLDARRVAFFGRSAGAELALLAAERPQPLRAAAVVAYYAPVDLAGGWNDPPRPDPANVRGILETYIGGPPDAAHAGAYRAASPFDGARRAMPPALLICGARDELVLVSFQRAFAARLRSLGVPVVALELPWANHAFDEVDGLGAAIAHDATLRFLDATLAARGSKVPSSAPW
ncbi:MAG TPA: alpha/beta hydrolase [Dongiaceae bacterium]|nr:alpha/beta hydrolase [Dongiaceae bacterium]